MVYFISDNIISSLGFNTKENFDALKSGKTGIRLVNNPEMYPSPFQASLIDDNRLQSKFNSMKADEKQFTRLEKMLILSVKDALSQAAVDITSKRTVILLSTTKGNIDLLEQSKKGKYEPQRVTLWRLGKVVGDYFKNPNEVIVLSNACVSGVLAINIGALLIKSKKYDHVIVTGGDIVTRFVVSGFMSFLSLSNQPCRPFDADRDGLSLGEGAGTIILSNKKAENESIVYAGGASANDANHISGPSRTGEGSYIAIQKTLAEEVTDYSKIDHVSAHGTATLYNDEMESIAITRSHLQHVPLNSFKGSWGHTLGAAGIIETAAVLAEMHENIVLKTAGFRNLGVSHQVHVIHNNVQKELNFCLKLSSGFGGSNATVLLKKI